MGGGSSKSGAAPTASAAPKGPPADFPIEDAEDDGSGTALRDRMQRDRDAALNRPPPSRGAKQLCAGKREFEAKGSWREREGTARGINSADQHQWSLIVSSAAEVSVTVKVSWARKEGGYAADEEDDGHGGHAVMLSLFSANAEAPLSRLKSLPRRLGVR